MIMMWIGRNDEEITEKH
ncbi:Protein of unknown function [Lactobacillus delbrueckii subsp. bulgaricus]|nr:Protein of unknown function [Lactobacillus delbrueckii subsp. bulgaricus]CDR75214.1 Protein of unknown function [Lactobacillus delbrueckii subsp. bulgaricus]